MIVSARPLTTLNISTGRKRRFLVCILNYPFLVIAQKYLAVINYSKARFMKTVYSVIFTRLWYIPLVIKLRIKNSFKRVRRFVIFIYCIITLDNTFIFWPAFLLISTIWALKASLWSIFIPSNFSHLLFMIWLFSTLITKPLLSLDIKWNLDFIWLPEKHSKNSTLAFSNNLITLFILFLRT